MPKALILLLWLVVRFNAMAGSIPSTLHGESRRYIVFVQAKDSFLTVEYCHSSINGIWLTHFDTLRLSHHKYIGKISALEIRGSEFLFKPGNVKLTEGYIDKSFTESRNQGYLTYVNKQFVKDLSWTGASLNEFSAAKWEHKCKEINDYEFFKQQVWSVCDSLRNYFGSITYSSRFRNVIIQDYRIFPKKYLETTDTARIYKVWHFLSQARPNDRNLFSCIIQIPIEIAVLSLYDMDVALMATPFVYPALIGTEIFIGNRLSARKTFKIKFYPNDKGGKKIVLKIRKSTIIEANYTYTLPFDMNLFLSGL